MIDYTLKMTDERAEAITKKQGSLDYLQTYCDQLGDVCIAQVNDDLRSGLINSVREGLNNEEMRFLASMPIEDLKAAIAEMKAKQG